MILKECALSINVPLSRLFILSLLNGVFPTCWKKANIIPFFRKGDRYNIKNYRPVTLLSPYQKYLKKLYTATFINTAN